MTKYYTLSIYHRDVFSNARSIPAIAPVNFSGARNAKATATNAMKELFRRAAERYGKRGAEWKIEAPSAYDADHWSVSGTVTGKQGEVLYHAAAYVTGSALCGHVIPTERLLDSI